MKVTHKCRVIGLPVVVCNFMSIRAEWPPKLSQYWPSMKDNSSYLFLSCAVNSQRLKPQLLPVPTPEVTPWRPHQIRAVAFGLKGERTN